MLSALRRAATRAVDPRPLAVARIMVAAAALVRAAEAHSILGRVLEPGRVRLPYVPWLAALPDAAASVALALWAAAALALLLGWRTRLAGAALALAIGYVLLLDEQTYSNHLYLLALLALLLAWGDAGAAYSLDARRAGRRPVLELPVLLLRLQLSIVYGFAALAKLNPVFLSGAVLNASLERDGWLTLPAALRTQVVLVTLSALTVAGEAFLALGVWSPRLRRWAFVTALALHAGMVLMLVDFVRLQLAVFAVEMFALFVLFIDPGHRVRLVVWDDQCSFCRSCVAWLRRFDWLGLHRWVGSSEAAAFGGTGITREEADRALQWVGPDGRAAGFDAVGRVLEALPASFLWAPLLRLPPIRWAGDRVYRAVAARRRCWWVAGEAVREGVAHSSRVP